MGDFAQSAISADLVPFYYALCIIAMILGGFWALKKYGDRQRQSQLEQGAKEQQLADRLEANTKAADKNTASIEKMSDKLDSFSAAVDKRLTLVDYRVERLEEQASNGANPFTHPGGVCGSPKLP